MDSVDYSADARLARVLEAIRVQHRSLRSLIQDKAVGACVRLKVDPWDFDDDGDWDRVGAVVGERFQQLLADDLQQWFADASGIPVLRDPRRAEAERELKTKLAEYGLRVEEQGSNLHERFGVTHEELALADANFDSRIHNMNFAKPAKGTTELITGPLVHHPEFWCVISVVEPSFDSEWDLVGWLSKEILNDPSITRFQQQELRGLLWSWGDRAQKQLPTAKLVSLVIPVRTIEEVAAWRALIGEICAHAVPAIRWYWMGKWSALIESQMSTSSPLRHTSYLLKDPVRPDQEPIDAQVYILNQGIFFRCLTGAASALLQVAGRALTARGFLIEMPADLKKRLEVTTKFSVLGVVPIRESF